MIGKEGSYLVTRDREVVEKRLRAELAASHKLSSAAATEGESELSLVKRPNDVPLPTGAGKSACRAAELLVHGNQEFRMGSYVSAIDSYSQGLVAVSTATGGEGDLEPMRIAILLNRAACLLHNESREENLGQSYSNKALQDCDIVLQADPRNTSALTRRALAFEAMELFDEAVEALEAAITQRPDDKPLAAMLPGLREKAAAEQEEENLIDWCKFGLSDPTDTAVAAAEVSPALASSRPEEERLATSPGVAADVQGEPETEPGLAAQLTGLSGARPALRLREYEKAAEAMIPKEPEELEDDEDAWTAQAYGDADFSAQEEEDKKKKSEINNLEKKGENGDEDNGEGADDESAPPLDDSGTSDSPSHSLQPATAGKIEMLDGDDDDGMPGLENPDAANG